MSHIPGPGVVAPVLPPGKLVLKYLFGAHLKDGREIFQTLEDVSLFVPGKNATYDLLVHDDQGEPMQHPLTGRVMMRADVELFRLSGCGYHCLVDLRDGHFEISGENSLVPAAGFYVSIPPPNSVLRLLYFRRRRHHLFQGSVELGQECEYHFGWETEDEQHRAELILV